jgi:hypothetical protein
VRAWHTVRGFSDVGYHLFIWLNGKVELGRPIKNPGAHCRGNNSHSIGICLGGKDVTTKRQKQSLVNWIKHYMQIFDLKPSDVKGHYEYNENKTCPNLDMDELRKKLKE